MTKLFFFRHRGFTLIELLVVIAILAILAAAVMIAINPEKRLAQARDATRLAQASTLTDSVAEYFVTHGDYPPDPAVSTETEFASDEGPNWIPGLDNLPQDPSQAGIRQFLARIIPSNVRSTNTKPQVAGTQSVTITADGSPNLGAYLRYGDTTYPIETNGNCAFSYTYPTSLSTVGQTYAPKNIMPYQVYRTYLSFDTSSLPQNAQILSVKLKLRVETRSWQAKFPETIKIRKNLWGDTLGCEDWGGNPPTTPEVGGLTLTGQTYKTMELNLNNSVINPADKSQVSLSTDRDEKDEKPTVKGDDQIYISQGDDPTIEYRPQLIIEYTTEPQISPEPSPSPPPKGCKNKKHIYCYMVTTDHKSAILWAQLDNEDDERLYYKPTASCKNTPPPDSFLNYCINNP